MLPNDNVSMSVGHLDHVLIVYSSHHRLNHKLAVVRMLLERCYSIVTEEDDRKKEEEDVAKTLSKCGPLDHRHSTGSNRTSWRNLWRTKQKKQRTQETITKVWSSCHMWKDWVRHLQEFWNLTASSELTVLTERYGTLWCIRRIRSRMKRRPNWSVVCLARTAPAHTLERHAGSSVWAKP